MISLEAALAACATTLPALPAESVATLDALGRVLAADAHAQTDLPRFDQSAMDGYALCAADTAGASAARPVLLPIVLQLPAGGTDRNPTLAPQTAARILTGALLPAGADTMIPQESAERIGDALRITAPCEPRRNIRWRAEELSRGTRIAERGRRIGPGLLAALVNADVGTLSVRRRPRLGSFVTGDELRPAGAALRPGEIHDSNGPLISSLLRRWGQASVPVQHLRDEPDDVRRALEAAFADCDLVISAGGASVGDKDYLPATAEALGARRVFWRVAQKPGKPIFFGVVERKAQGPCAVLALPGNPGAVLIGMLLYVRAALGALEGVRAPGARWHNGLLQTAVERDAERARLLRMQLDIDSAGVARLLPLPHQDSHMISNLERADVLVWIEPGDTPAAAGTPTRWTAMPG